MGRVGESSGSREGREVSCERRNRGWAVRRRSGGEVRECGTVVGVRRVGGKAAGPESWRGRGWRQGGRRVERQRSPEKIVRGLKFTSDTPPEKNK